MYLQTQALERSPSSSLIQILLFQVPPPEKEQQNRPIGDVAISKSFLSKGSLLTQ